MHEIRAFTQQLENRFGPQSSIIVCSSVSRTGFSIVLFVLTNSELARERRNAKTYEAEGA